MTRFVIDNLGKRRPISPKITEEAVIDACERRMTSLDNPGFCIECGLEHGGCEPDARDIQCEGCGQHTVFGADELAIAMM